MDEAERLEMWKLYSKTHDPKIKEQLILEYSQVVKFVAGRVNMYLGNNVEYDDLVGYGVFGLIDAIDKFDYTKNIKFETYASLRIRGAILDNIRRMDWIPRSLRKKQKDMDRAVQDLESRGIEANDKNVAEKLGITVEEYYKWEDQTKGLYLSSLEEHVEQSGETKIKEDSHKRFDHPEERVAKEETKQQLLEAINSLNDKEKQIISLYYYEEMTLKEISLILEISESRVSQLHTKSLKKMKEFLGNNVELLANI